MSSDDASQRSNVRTFFSGHAATWDALYGTSRNPLIRLIDVTLRHDIYDRYEATLESIGDPAGKSILDVGCGSGIYSVHLAQQGARRVVGVDVAEGMVEICRQRAEAAGVADRCTFHTMEFPEASAATLGGERFDHTIVMGVMDYMADPVAFLRGVRASTAGSAIISFPLADPFRYPIRRWRYRTFRGITVFHYRTEDVVPICREAGFGTVDFKHLPQSGGSYIVTARP